MTEYSQLRFEDSPEENNISLSEDPLEAIYGPEKVLSFWEEQRLLAEQNRLEKEYKAERNTRRVNRRSFVEESIRSGQIHLPDIFRKPVPETGEEQLRMFSELAFRPQKPISKELHTPTGIPMYPQDRMIDVINGRDGQNGS